MRLVLDYNLVRSTTDFQMKDWDKDFAAFIAAYPRERRNVHKLDASKAWMALIKIGIEPEAVMFVLSKRIREDWAGREASFIPYPASFLRAESFNEVLLAVPAVPTLPFEQPAQESELLERAQLIRKVRQRELAIWEEEFAEHSHDVGCDDGMVCALAPDKRPIIPTLESIIELLRGTR